MSLVEDIRERARHSVLLRMLLMGFLILVLQIPILQIDGTVSERELTRQAAIDDVTRTWGGHQDIVGPVLSIPYVIRSTDSKGQVTARTVHAHFLSGGAVSAAELKAW